jgi:hypothetical protein
LLLGLYSDGRGQGEVELAALPCNAGTFNPQVTVHSLHELFADVESQACSSHRTRLVTLEPDKFLEEQGNFLRGNARTSILDTNADGWKTGSTLGRTGLSVRGVSTDGHSALYRGILEGIGEEIEEDLVKRVLFGSDPQVLGNVDDDVIILPCLGFKEIKHAINTIRQRDGSDLKLFPKPIAANGI